MAVDLEPSANSSFASVVFHSWIRIEDLYRGSFPKPFFKKARKSWYVEINRKQIKLGSDKEEAFQQCHQLMQQPAEEATTSPESLVGIVDAFLDWTHRNRAPDTYAWYRYRLQRFVDKYLNMLVFSLKPFHVEEWMDDYDIAQTTQRNYFRSIKRCLAWATRQRRIEKNPLEALDIPGSRAT